MAYVELPCKFEQHSARFIDPLAVYAMQIKFEVQNNRNISQFGGQKWAVLKELLPGDLCLTSQEDADYVHSMFSIIGLVSLALNL